MVPTFSAGLCGAGELRGKRLAATGIEGPAYGLDSHGEADGSAGAEALAAAASAVDELRSSANLPELRRELAALRSSAPVNESMDVEDVANGIKGLIKGLNTVYDSHRQ